jgi:hypothetical protein
VVRITKEFMHLTGEFEKQVKSYALTQSLNNTKWKN